MKRLNLRHRIIALFAFMVNNISLGKDDITLGRDNVDALENLNPLEIKGETSFVNKNPVVIGGAAVILTSAAVGGATYYVKTQEDEKKKQEIEVKKQEIQKLKEQAEQEEKIAKEEREKKEAAIKVIKDEFDESEKILEQKKNALEEFEKQNSEFMENLSVFGEGEINDSAKKILDEYKKKKNEVIEAKKKFEEKEQELSKADSKFTYEQAQNLNKKQKEQEEERKRQNEALVKNELIYKMQQKELEKLEKSNTVFKSILVEIEKFRNKKPLTLSEKQGFAGAINVIPNILELFKIKDEILNKSDGDFNTWLTNYEQQVKSDALANSNQIQDIKNKIKKLAEEDNAIHAKLKNTELEFVQAEAEKYKNEVTNIHKQLEIITTNLNKTTNDLNTTAKRLEKKEAFAQKTQEDLKNAQVEKEHMLREIEREKQQVVSEQKTVMALKNRITHQDNEIQNEQIEKRKILELLEVNGKKTEEENKKHNKELENLQKQREKEIQKLSELNAEEQKKIEKQLEEFKQKSEKKREEFKRKLEKEELKLLQEQKEKELLEQEYKYQEQDVKYKSVVELHPAFADFNKSVFGDSDDSLSTLEESFNGLKNQDYITSEDCHSLLLKAQSYIEKSGNLLDTLEVLLKKLENDFINTLDIEEALEIQEQHYALNKKKNELEETNEKYKLIISLGDDILKNIVEMFPQPRSKMDNPTTIKTHLEELKNKFDSLVTEDLEKKLRKAAELQIAAELEKERLELNKLGKTIEEVKESLSELDLRLRNSLEKRIDAIMYQVEIKNEIKGIENEIKGLKEQGEKEQQEVLEQLSAKKKDIIAELLKVEPQGISKDKTSEIEIKGLDQLISDLVNHLELESSNLENELRIIKNQLREQMIRLEGIDLEILHCVETKKKFQSVKTKVEMEFNETGRHLENTENKLSFIENEYGKTNELHLACSLDLNIAIQGVGEEDKKLQKLSDLMRIDLKLNHLQQQLLEVDIEYFNNKIDDKEAALSDRQLKKEIEETQLSLSKEEGGYNKQIKAECNDFMLWREKVTNALIEKLDQVVDQNEVAEIMYALNSKKTKLAKIYQEKLEHYNIEIISISEKKNEIDKHLRVLKDKAGNFVEEIARLELEMKSYNEEIAGDRETIERSKKIIEQTVLRLGENDLRLNELQKTQKDAQAEYNKLQEEELSTNKALVGVGEDLKKHREESLSIKALQKEQQINEEKKESQIKELTELLSKTRRALEDTEKETKLVKKTMELDLMQISSSIAQQEVQLIHHQREGLEGQSRESHVVIGEEGESLLINHQRENLEMKQSHESPRKGGGIKSQVQTVGRVIRGKLEELQGEQRLKRAELEIFNVIESKSKEPTIGLAGSSLVTFEELKEKKKALEILKENYSYHEDKEKQILYDISLEINRIERDMYQLDIQIAEHYSNDSRHALHAREQLNQKKAELEKDYETRKNSNHELQREYINKIEDYLGVKSKISQQSKENPKLDMLYQEISYTEQILEISDKINELNSILESVSGDRQILEINKKIKELKNEQSNLLEKMRYFNIINSILFFPNDIKENKTTLTKVLYKIKENYQQTTKILEQIPNFNNFNKKFNTESVSIYIHNFIDLQKACREQINSDKKELQSQELSDRELLERLFAMFSQSQKPKTKKEIDDIKEKIKTYIQHKRKMIERKMLFYAANIVSACGIKMDKGFRNEQDFLLIYAKLAQKHSTLNDDIFTTLTKVHSFVQWDKNFSSQEETNSLFEKPWKPSDETLLPLYNILAEDSSINTKSLLEICDKYNVLDIERVIIAQQSSRKDFQNQTHFLVKIYKGLSEVWNYLMDQQKIITIKEELVKINQQFVKVNSIMSMVKQEIRKIEDNLNENFIDGILEDMMYKNKLISNEGEGEKLKKQIVKSMRVDMGAIQKIVSSVDLIYWQFTDLLFEGRNQEAVDQYVIIQEKLLKGNSKLSYKDIYKYLTGVDILERDIKVTDIMNKIHLLIQNGTVNNPISARSEYLNKEWGHDVSKKLKRLYNVFYMCHFLKHNSNSRALYFHSLRDKFNEVWDQLDRNKHRILDVESRVQVELELQYTRRVLDSDFSNVNYQNIFNMISDQDLQFVIQLIITDLFEEKDRVEISDVVTKLDCFGIEENECLVTVIKEMLQLLDNGKHHNIRGYLPSILQQKTPIEELTLSVNACVSSLSQNNIFEKTHLHQTSQNPTLLDDLQDLKVLLDNIVNNKSGKTDETDMNFIYRYLNNVKAPLQELEININGEIESLLEVKECYDSSKKQDISVITNYLSLKYAAKKTIQRLQNNIEDFINLEIYDKIQPVNQFASLSNMKLIHQMRNYYNVISTILEGMINMDSKSSVLDQDTIRSSLLKDIIELDKQFNMISYDDTKLDAALLKENIQNLELVSKEIDSLDKLLHEFSFQLEPKPEGVIKDISSKVLLKNMTIKIRSIKDKIKKIQTNQNVMKESVLYNLLTESIDAINKFEHGVDTQTQESIWETHKQLVLEFNALTGKQEKADDIYDLYAVNNNNFKTTLQNIYKEVDCIPDENIENVIDIRKQIENYNRLFDEKHNLYTVFLTTRNEKIQLEHKIESANKECIAIKEKDDTRTKELQSLEKEITDLNKTLETLQKDEKEIGANLEQILKLHKETKTALQLNSENRLNAEEQKRQIDMKNDLKNQENDILKANKQLGDITTKSNKIIEEIETKQRKVEGVKKDRELLKGGYENKQKKIDEIKKQLNTKATKEQNVQQNIDTKQEKILNEIQQTFEKIKNGIEKVEEDKMTAYWKFRGELQTLENRIAVFMERPEDLRERTEDLYENLRERTEDLYEIITRTNVTLNSMCTITKNNVESAINELDKATYGINTILNNPKFTTENSKFTTEEWRMLDELQQEQIKKTKEDLQKLFERIETWPQKQEIHNERENKEQEYEEEVENEEQEYEEEVENEEQEYEEEVDRE